MQSHRFAPDDNAAASVTSTPAGRSLVLLTVPGDVNDGAAVRVVRPQAGFLAQLIATARRLPQTRERRRGTPFEAQAIYGTPAAPVSIRQVSRSV